MFILRLTVCSYIYATIVYDVDRLFYNPKKPVIKNKCFPTYHILTLKR